MRPAIPGLVLAAALAAVTVTAEARLYQWENPTTGLVELSGTPPAWYRSPAGGPRVLVFENGLLLDDTAIAVAPDLGEDLRESAFREFEQRQNEEALKRLERLARRERARQREAEEREAEEVAGLEAESAPSPVQAAVDDVPEILDPAVVDRLKSMLRAWDQQQLGN